MSWTTHLDFGFHGISAKGSECCSISEWILHAEKTTYTIGLSCQGSCKEDSTTVRLFFSHKLPTLLLTNLLTTKQIVLTSELLSQMTCHGSRLISWKKVPYVLSIKKSPNRHDEIRKTRTQGLCFSQQPLVLALFNSHILCRVRCGGAVHRIFLILVTGGRDYYGLYK